MVHYFICENDQIIPMDISSFLPITSFFFNQILEDVNVKGLILSSQIMVNFSKKEIREMIIHLDLTKINYEKYENILICVVRNYEDDQIWLVRYRSKNILMLSSEF